MTSLIIHGSSIIHVNLTLKKCDSRGSLTSTLYTTDMNFGLGHFKTSDTGSDSDMGLDMDFGQGFGHEFGHELRRGLNRL